MLTPDDLAALREYPDGATFRDVLALVAEVTRLTASVTHWETRSSTYEQTLLDLTEAMMEIRRNLVRCQRVSSCGHLEDAKAVAVESLAWREAQDP